jgi:hypothetical protein
MVRIVRNLGRNGLNIHKKPFDVPSVASVGRVGAGVLPADHPQVGSALPPAGAAGLEEAVARGRIVCADNAKGYPPDWCTVEPFAVRPCARRANAGINIYTKIETIAGRVVVVVGAALIPTSNSALLRSLRQGVERGDLLCPWGRIA